MADPFSFWRSYFNRRGAAPLPGPSRSMAKALGLSQRPGSSPGARAGSAPGLSLEVPVTPSAGGGGHKGPDPTRSWFWGAPREGAAPAQTPHPGGAPVGALGVFLTAPGRKHGRILHPPLPQRVQLGNAHTRVWGRCGCPPAPRQAPWLCPHGPAPASGAFSEGRHRSPPTPVAGGERPQPLAPASGGCPPPSDSGGCPEPHAAAPTPRTVHSRDRARMRRDG